MKASLVRRMITTAIGVPVVMAAVFGLPSDVVFAIFLVAFAWAAFEFIQISRTYAPTAPLWGALPLILLASGAGFSALRQGFTGQPLALWLVALGGTVTILASCGVVLSKVEVRDGLTAVGIVAFAIPYFALPPIAFYQLHHLDPWLVVLMFAMVWLGDTAAFFIGGWIGKRKLAPITSPNKTWEGSVAGLLTAVVASAVWSQLRLGEVLPGLLLLAALVSVTAQLGDLVESMIKRGAGVKDSSQVLPGHGGFFDRLDALLLSTPLFVTGLWWMGFERLVP